MKVNILTLCDFAQNNNGKLTIVGVCDLIVTKKVPFKKNLFFVAKICFNANESGKKHTFKVTISKKGEQVPLIIPVTNELVIESKDRDTNCNLIFELGDFVFPTAGDYIFKLEVDDVVNTSSLIVKLEN